MIGENKEFDVGGYIFKKVCKIEPIRDDRGVVRSFLPQSRYDNTAQHRLHAYGGGPFCEFKIPNRLSSSGAYAIFVASTMMYIGRCDQARPPSAQGGLSRRFNAGYGKIQPRNCFAGGQQPNCRINNLIYGEATKSNPIELWFFETPKFVEIEDELNARFRPRWNLR